MSSALRRRGDGSSGMLASRLFTGMVFQRHCGKTQSLHRMPLITFSFKKYSMDFPGCSVVKNLPSKAGSADLIHDLGRFLG